MNKNDYLRKFVAPDMDFAAKLYAENRSRNDLQPSIEPELARFLSFTIRLTKAQKVLELGTSNGYSSIWIAEALRKTGGRLITVENKERIYQEAAENIKKAGCSDIVTQKLGDAEQIVKELDGGFDIIFQDCGKYLYPKLYEELYGLTKSGGIIIADDTLFKADPTVRGSLGDYTHEYNKRIFADDRFYSTILSLGHGVTVSIKR